MSKLESERAADRRNIPRIEYNVLFAQLISFFESFSVVRSWGTTSITASAMIQHCVYRENLEWTQCFNRLAHRILMSKDEILVRNRMRRLNRLLGAWEADTQWQHINKRSKVLCLLLSIVDIRFQMSFIIILMAFYLNIRWNFLDTFSHIHISTTICKCIGYSTELVGFDRTRYHFTSYSYVIWNYIFV